MGQSASTNPTFRLSKSTFTAINSPVLINEAEEEGVSMNEPRDFTIDLPDKCLSFIFQLLTSADRKRCSLVCCRWLKIEGQSRHRLSLKAPSFIFSMIPSLFSRFDSVTSLALRNDPRCLSISDEALIMISLRCRNLTRLKLRGCREISDLGIAGFSENCKSLKKLSFGSCDVGAKGINAVLNNCSVLEELSVKRGIKDGSAAAAEPVGPGLAAGSLKTICLKELYNGHCFAPLIRGAKCLKSLKIIRCLGEWDHVFEAVANQVNAIVEIHVERIQISDLGLTALSKCSGLEILHLVKTPECTNIGLAMVAESCKLLTKLRIDGWRNNQIGDDGLIVVAKSCLNLQELVLIGVNPTKLSLEAFALHCLNFEKLALCGSDTVGDTELCCISEKCMALRKLCIKKCPITDDGMEALGTGCPNLVKVKVRKCRGVTIEGADRLRTRRALLVVDLDTPEVQNSEASPSKGGGAQKNAIQFPTMGIASGSTSRSTSFKSRLGLSRSKKLSCFSVEKFWEVVTAP